MKSVNTKPIHGIKNRYQRLREGGKLTRDKIPNSSVSPTAQAPRGANTAYEGLL